MNSLMVVAMVMLYFYFSVFVLRPKIFSNENWTNNLFPMGQVTYMNVYILQVPCNSHVCYESLTHELCYATLSLQIWFMLNIQSTLLNLWW